MYPRLLAEELKLAAQSYPVVTVIGPRQSGKTTLVKSLFPHKAYVNLEAPDIRIMAEEDPRSFLEQYPDGAILDEIQRVPSLLSYVQIIVDERDAKGLFILTGSHQVELHQAISQSLAGRTAILKLLPMSIRELSDAGIPVGSVNPLLLNGGYPRLYKDHLNPTKAYSHYFQTYIERDVRQIVKIKELSQFQRFIRLCAGRIGQLLNYESLSNDVGVSSPTIKEWISVLEASFIIFRLQPYFENFGKRMVKSSKLYFTDVGLASYLLGIVDTSQMVRDPLRGHLFENLVVLELMKERLNRGFDPQLYYFRDAHGHEVDLIFQSGDQLIPIEIKASKTFNTGFLKNLDFFYELAPERVRKGYLIYTGDQEQRIKQSCLLNYTNAAKALKIF